MKPFKQIKIFSFYILYFCLITITLSQSNKIPIFRCNHDSIKEKPKFAEYSSSKNSTYKRKLDYPVDSDGFKKFNIYLDLVNLEEEINQYHLEKYRDLFIKGTKDAIKTLESLLRVKPINKNYAIKTESLVNESISLWNTSILGSGTEIKLSDLDFDLLVFARLKNMGEETIATASARLVDNPTGQPILGIININNNTDYSKNNSLTFFTTVILHEMTHVLGFSNFFFQSYYHNIIKAVDSDNITRSYINSTKVVEVAKKYFNCSEIIGVPLEDFGGEGTVGSHWEERILLGDYMNGVVYSEEQVISEFTLALLEDSGYYKANYYTGGLMQYGKNKGCAFLNEKCVINRTVNDKFKNEFFDQFYKGGNIDPSCSSGRQSRTYHYINEYVNEVPKEYQYYPKKNLGGRSSCNYCPVSQSYSLEEKNSYYTGHCSKLGNGEYGSQIRYNNNKNYKSGETMNILAESYSDNSFCVLSSLISKNISNYNQYSDTIRAVCYQMHCSSRSLTIQINDNYLVCPREGGKINATFFSGYLLCPDYYLICSGTVLCNDIYDCIEKESSLKPDIIYDYESNTSQDIEEASLADFSINAYELSNDGICPQYCSQCNELGLCIKCKEDYAIVKLKGNVTIERECKPLSELSIGYYKIDEIYYECMENCDKCSNSTECIECSSNHTYAYKKCFETIEKCLNYDEEGLCTKCEIKSHLSESREECLNGVEHCAEEDDNYNCKKCDNGFRVVNGKFCYKIIENCDSYGEGDFCEKCDVGFGFEENDTLTCKNISLFEEYFSKNGDGINYYKCDDVNEGGIDNCRICDNNNTNKELICTECREKYILKDEENKVCYQNDTFRNNISFYYEDSFHVKTCSKAINNCIECIKSFENLKCEKCFDNYFFVNENYSVCYKKEEIVPIDEYFLNESDRQYLSCDNEDYHSIKYCKNCTNKTSCNLCKEEFTFIDNNKSLCKNISELGNQYIMDINDTTIYRKCDYYMEHCDTCNEINQCLSCIDGFGLYNDGTKCVNDNENLYYKNSTDDLYYLCDYNLAHCEKCLNETTCIKCTSDYVEINNLCYEATQNCKEYNESAKCVECLPGYDIVIENEEIKCEIGMENCNEVDGNGTCISCDKGFRLTNQSICYKIIENCDRHGDGDFCEKCEVGFGFEGNDTSNCKNISLFEEYFSKNGDGINFYKCNDVNEGGIDNCRICDNNNTNKELICTECSEKYILKDEESKVCYQNDTFINNLSYYYEDSFHVKTCSKSINNCNECTKNNNTLKCEKCLEYYFIVNNIDITCNKSEEINPSDEFYFDEQKKEYYFCGNKDYHSIENCKKCTNKTSCNFCKEEFTFIDDNKLVCKNISELKNDYIKDINDPSIYRKCNYYIANCKTCNQTDKCLSCDNQYGLYFDSSKCVKTNNDEYYQNKTDNKYYYCNNSIDKCEKCNGANNCKKCVNNYVRLNSNFSLCKSIDEIDLSEYYINPNDENNYIKCSNSISNCLKCNSSQRCDLCQNDFIFLNDNFKRCYNKSATNLSKYFTKDNLTYYSCEVDIYKNNPECFTKNPNQIIILVFLQAQMINQTLYCFMLTHSPLPKNFSIKLKIQRYNLTVRNLQGQGTEEVEEEIILTTNDDSNGIKNNIISFSSDKIFHENEHAQIKELNYSKDDTGITHDVVENNHVSIIFDNSSELANSGEVSKLIKEGKLTGFTGNDDEIENNGLIIDLNLDNIDGCKFDLNSGDGSLNSSDNYNFELAEYNNKENIINAQCSNSKNNMINCKINQDVDSEFYFYKYFIISKSGKHIILPNGEENKFKLLCQNNKRKNIIIIIAICLIIFVIIIILISTRFCCGKNTKNETNIKKKAKWKGERDSSSANENIKGNITS